jgi:hypothetical protein
MKVTRLLMVGVLAASAGAAADKKSTKAGPVTMTGCVLAGDKPGSYVLTHVRDDTGTTTTTNANMELGAAGLRTIPENVYWLESVKELHGLVGRKVEITGEIEKMEAGEIEVEKEPRNASGPDNEVEVESGTRQIEAKTNRPVDGKPGPAVGHETKTKHKVMVHHVKVEAVRQLAATCP